MVRKSVGGASAIPPFVMVLFRQVLAEADLLSKFTTNITWRGGELCEGMQVSCFQNMGGKVFGAMFQEPWSGGARGV